MGAWLPNNAISRFFCRPIPFQKATERITIRYLCEEPRLPLGLSFSPLLTRLARRVQVLEASQPRLDIFGLMSKLKGRIRDLYRFALEKTYYGAGLLARDASPVFPVATHFGSIAHQGVGMALFSVGPGEDVEAWCTRCRMNLNHRVIAVVGNTIQRVQCLTCGGDHKYYPPKHSRSATAEKRVVKGVETARSQNSRKLVQKAGGKALGEWTTIMKEMPETTIPRPYLASESYESGEFIMHSVFGAGRVLDVLGSERIQVIFKEGRKVLICNKRS